VRSDAQPPHLSHEPLRVVVLVSADGLLVGTAEVCCHLLGGILLTGARGLCDAAIPTVAGSTFQSLGQMGADPQGIGDGRE
jgi:hypothetical protein